MLKRLLHNTTVRNGSLFTIFSFLNSGISFVLLIIIAKYIDPEGYGYVNLFNTIATLLGFCISLNTAGVLSVNYFNQDKMLFRMSVKAVTNLTIVCSVVLLTLTTIFHSQFSRFTGLPYIYIVFAIINSTSNVFSNMLLNIWRIEEKVMIYGIFSFAMAISNFVLCVFFVIVMNKSWQGQIYSYVICNIIFCLLGLIGLVKKGYLSNISPTKSSYTDCLKFGIPLIPHNISVWLRQGMDRIFINNFLMVEQVGLFGFSMNFANILIIVGNAFNNTNSVYIFKNLSKGGNNVQKSLRKQTIGIISMFFILSVIVFLSTYLMIPIFFPKYAKCLPYILPQCIGAFFQCIYLQFVNFLFYYKRTKGLMFITFSVSILHLLLSFILTRYSIYFTLWIGALSNIIITLLVFLYSRKFYKLF